MAEIAIVGYACRLPGASSPSKLWDLMREGRCAITQIPPDRWSLERLGHPRQNERGRSYTWAAGVLDDIWGFDAAAFGLSPREAEQMDPQQRLLLELTWEALEDAGIRPSSLSGSETGVFVGASTNDHGTMKVFDIAATDGYFATGNAASILSNRISYVFDLNGPSFTVDTACSSSLVALDAAVQSLRSGRVDTAIVGGVSILTAPFAFINFSQASMLSRIGLCQTFSANADGYVRSEGGGVLVLQTAEAARAGNLRVHSRILATRINSDGRTNGIALPSKKKQAQLLDQLYRREGIDPERLAFVEAHGTGTPVGDPIEAAALGEMLGQRRATPLPVGSIKSNIGHTEAAAGIAGVLKASMALEHDLLPPSLHCAELNPHIDFDRLNLAVARTSMPLPRGAAPRLAGVSSYGFGGTNSHAVLADPEPTSQSSAAEPASTLMLSARSRAALAALARAYADRIEAGPEPVGIIAGAANAHRERLDERLVVALDDPGEVPNRLRAFAVGQEDGGEGFSAATALAGDPAVAFVYSGNGGQWVGMGRAAYARHPGFRARFDEVDTLFAPLAGWSLVAMLHGRSLADEIGKTSVAQPLIFAIQTASTVALREAGLRPAMVMGHSVGEVAAAEAAGVFDLATAVRLIYFRSLHQERVHGAGGMTVLIGSPEAAETIAATVPGASIAAYNSPRAFTFSGTVAGMEGVASAARGLKARAQKLDIDYPFHSPLIAPIEGPLLDSLGFMTPGHSEVPFISTVTGTVLTGSELTAAYWWRNIREPVLFSAAVEEANRRGARLFVEIGPSAILLSHVGDTLAVADAQAATVAVLDRKDTPGDPFSRAAAAALARGATVADAKLGAGPAGHVDLPTYPWQRKLSRLGETSEAVSYIAPRPYHPLVGARYLADELEWYGQIDTAVLPALADHVVDGHVLLPGAAFAEMALAVARDWLKGATASLADFEIHAPMILAGTGSRDVRCRVQPTTATVEIMSRPRLGQAAWQVHASAKILRQTHETAAPPPGRSASEPGGETVDGAEIYALADASGLSYGPAFRLLRSARRTGPTSIAVDLVEAAPSADGLGLDPARVDSCFHGLALLYRELAADGRLKPYVPVGAGEIRLHRPGVAIAGAILEVARSDDRSILVDFTLLDAVGDVVAFIRRARFQAMSAFRAADRLIEPIVADTILASEPLAVAGAAMPDAGGLRAAAEALDAIARDEAPAPAFVLLDGWATAAAFGLAEELAEDGRLDPAALVAAGRLPSHLEGWLRRLLVSLRRSGLATADTSGPVELLSGIDLPDPADILRALAADHPERSAELLLACRTGALVDAIASGRHDRTRPVTSAALDGFELGGVATRSAAELVADLVAHTARGWPDDRRLRLLQLGDGPLTARAVALAERHHASLTLVEPDRRRLERARLGFERNPALAFEESLAALPANGFDLVLGAQSGRRLLADPSAAESLAAAMTPGAVLAMAEPSPSVFRDLVFGLQGAMAGEERATEAGTERTWRDLLEGAGLTGIAVERTRGTDFAWLVLGEKPADRLARAGGGDTLVIGRGDGRLEATADALATMLRFSGLKVASVRGETAVDDTHFEGRGVVVYLAEPSAGVTPAERLMARCRELKAMAAAIGARKLTLWIVCPGATRPVGGDPVEAGVWAFCRTLANEIASIDVRLVDLDPGLDGEVAARRLRDAILSDTAEREIVLDADRTRVVRFGKLASEEGPAIGHDRLAMRLVKGDHASGLDRLEWERQERRPPAAGEVEVEVAAAGLNFRDVMWGLSILPEEILEDGFAGATLGLECAGRVVRLGADVVGLAVGDEVLAFAKAALATHVTVPAAVVAHRPPAIGSDAAASVPVAFLTAFYGLIRCARLAEDEWVLIHGGAGGVGLAAIQIARWRGARVIATAGSPERRDLLTVLGAEHVFDSRSNGFVDDVRRVTGSGVDVVLNSLSGEAMERSLAVLRPFGRFVELGKRDYVANTHIGLKPFRRNLSYFGVDLDQLMLKDDATGRELFAEVMALFDAGALAPLPFRSFTASETVEAFRVMQRSGHIGKIVIKPPPIESVAAPPAEDRPLVVSASGVHLVTGGLGGFGLETARWLVDAGARNLVLVGRTGAASDSAKAAVAALRERGATVEPVALDITDESAVTALFDRFGRDLPPLAGVAHAATVFDDAMIANMTDAKLAAVVGAKVTGAVNLDRLTRALTLDYFLLFSSATTLIGSPGQGAYVAANAFLEGLARSRRAVGLAGLAVAWGAIEDVGVLTRSSTAAANLLTRSGVLGMAARQALDAMARAARRLPAGPEAAVLAVAAVNWANAREHLPVLRSSSFERLMHGSPAGESAGKGKINVRALVEERGKATAAALIVDTVLEEIARILRLPKEDVSRHKPLMDIGLDSLMAVELGMGVEERFELDAPLSTSVSTMSITELADIIVGTVGEGGDLTPTDLALRHLDQDARRDIVAALPTLAAGEVPAGLSVLETHH